MKVGFIDSGGGMRGIYTSGIMTALWTAASSLNTASEFQP